MKFNFKKIISVLASAVMLGSTVGIAAAATYPAPFVTGGVADVTVVVGAASPNNVDYIAATDVGSSLSTELASQTAGGAGTTSTATGGDSIEIIGPGSDYLNLGEGWDDVYGLDIDDNDLPDLLADGTYRNGENTDYGYTQTITLAGNRSVEHFADSDYNDKEPTLGIHLTKKQSIMNYTLDFSKDALSDVITSDDLDDFENTDLSLLGVDYRIVDATNTSGIVSLTLLGGSITGTLDLNEEKTETLSGTDYAIKLAYVDTTQVQFEVNGERTNKLIKGGIWKLSDGMSIGVKDLSYQNFAGGVMSAEYTLGAQKLKIEDGQKLELDDEDVDAITCNITESDSAGKMAISAIRLDWAADDEYFITSDSELVMPGLESVKFTMGEFYFPSEETIEINPETDGFELKVPIESGDASINILYGSGVNWTHVGKDSTGQLATTFQLNENSALHLPNNLTYNITTDDYMVVTYNTSNTAESYLVSLDNSKSSGINYTSFKDVVTGVKICENVKPTKTCKIGNAVVTIDFNDDDDEYINLHGGSGVSFDRIYTASGLEIQLPYLNDSRIDTTSTGGAISCGIADVTAVVNDEVKAVVVYNTSQAAVANQTCYNNHGVFQLRFIEEDKDGDLGKGATFNVTLGWTSTKATISSVSEEKFSGAKDFEIGNTDVYVGYVASRLATKSEFDTGGTQDSATFTYHGTESYAPLFIAAPAVTITSADGAGTELGSVTYYDNELTTAAKAKNLIVVGGSCINSVAAELLGGSLCASDFTDETGVGANQFLVQVFDNPYATGQVAMLVAGYEAADTKKAVTYVTMESPATDVGTELKKVTATYADVA